MNVGIIVYAAATIAAGIINLVWGDFEAGHQPIQAFGDHIAGRAFLANAASVWLIAGGAALLWKRTRKAGATMLLLVYVVFAAFWTPRLVTAPKVLGYHAPVYIGVLAGVAQQLILAAAAALVLRKWTDAARWIFALASIDFGLTHLTDDGGTARMVPAWMPMGGHFWVEFTGIAFILAGVAIAVGFFDTIAARLLALMLIVFSSLALAPLIVAYPHSHVAWGSNAYNLTAVGAVMILANWLSARRTG